MKTARALSVPTFPGWPILLAFLVVGVLALELGVSASTRVGIHPTPMAWLAIIITLALTLAGLANPHLPRTAGAQPRNGSPSAASPDAIDAAFNTWKSTAEVLDARASYPEFLYPADKARLAIFPTGTTFLAARFHSPEAALDAADGYRDFFGMTDGRGSLQSTWSGARKHTHDFASVRCQGELLLACSTRDRVHLDPRLVLSIASSSSPGRL